MAIDQSQRYCHTCQKPTLHIRHRFSEGMGCLLTILTGFLFLPIWIFASLSGSLSPFRCQQCGAKARVSVVGTIAGLAVVAAFLVGGVTIYNSVRASKSKAPARPVPAVDVAQGEVGSELQPATSEPRPALKSSLRDQLKFTLRRKTKAKSSGENDTYELIAKNVSNGPVDPFQINIDPSKQGCEGVKSKWIPFKSISVGKQRRKTFAWPKNCKPLAGETRAQ